MNASCNTYDPDYAVSPWETVRECIELKKLKKGYKEHKNVLEFMIDYDINIDELNSIYLEKATGIDRSFWVHAWNTYEKRRLSGLTKL